ncbi:MAG TPA: DUF4406 domain-containing protein [Microthrixaceae bacterium]|jgi:hypothetical protein|nr:DUF4406 domain-containing protein [Microthrixaceae bacterium]HNH38329.1 DUF4406 domain-containing protein [Microthrixaceae bacterium]
MKPLVYVAGPISGDPFGCVRQGVEAFDVLRGVGCTPILPQLSVLAEMVQHRPYEEWMAYDFEVIARCDALVRLPGESEGADREVRHARELGVRVYLFDRPCDMRALSRQVEALAPLDPRGSAA